MPVLATVVKILNVDTSTGNVDEVSFREGINKKGVVLRAVIPYLLATHFRECSENSTKLCGKYGMLSRKFSWAL